MKSNHLEMKRYFDLKKVNGASLITIKNYRMILEQLDEFIGKPFKETTQEDIISFISYKKDQGLSSNSIAVYKVVIKGFYRFIYDLPSHQYPDQVKNIRVGNHKRKVPIRPEDVITKEDIAFLLKYCRDYREEAMLVTLYESGCRLGEFTNVKIGHLKFDNRGIVLLVSGKTGERRIRLVESVPYIQRYLENHPLKGNRNAPLWVCHKKHWRYKEEHSQLSESTIQYFFRELRKRSGIDKSLNPHAFRHSRITELSKFLSDGKLKVFAGWTASSEMSGIYVHLSGRDLDNDLLQIAGVETEKEKRVSPLQAMECPRCHTKNPMTNTFCGLCGLILDEETAINEEIELEKLMEEVEKTRGVGEYIDQLYERMDEMSNRIRELEKQ